MKHYWNLDMLTYNTGPVTATEVSVSVWCLARAVCTSLGGIIAASAGVPLVQDRSIDGGSSHKSEEDSGNLHCKRSVLYQKKWLCVWGGWLEAWCPRVWVSGGYWDVYIHFQNKCQVVWISYHGQFIQILGVGRLVCQVPKVYLEASNWSWGWGWGCIAGNWPDDSFRPPSWKWNASKRCVLFTRIVDYLCRSILAVWGYDEHLWESSLLEPMHISITYHRAQKQQCQTGLSIVNRDGLSNQ